MSRFSSFARLSIAAALALVGTVFLGGCADKEKMEALTAENTALRSDKENLTQQLSASEARRGQVEAERDALAARQNQMQPGPGGSAPKGPGRDPRPSPRTEIITVAGDVAFSPGKADLTAAGKKELTEIAAKIKKSYATNHIRIEGYTDTDPITKSSWASNEALSAARAQAVEKFLASKGISAGRMESVGLGAAKPKSTKKDSRRVEIVVLAN